MVADKASLFIICYRLDSGSPAAYPALDLVGAFAATILPVLLPVLSSSVKVMRIMARCLVPTDGVPYEGNYDDTVIGTGNAEALAPSIALLIRLNANSTNSRNNGHLYIAGVPENVWVNGVWEPATFLPLAQTLAQNLALPLGASSAGKIYDPVIVSRLLNNVPRVPPVYFDVIYGDVSPLISQQRRRQSRQQGIKS